MKVEEFINLKKGNMSVEYSLKFSRLSRFAPSMVSTHMDEMSRSVTGVADSVKEECQTAMLHDDITLASLMVYAQSVEESKLCRISRNLKRSGSSDQSQPRFMKRAQIQDGPSVPKVKLEKGSVSQGGKPTCATC